MRQLRIKLPVFVRSQVLSPVSCGKVPSGQTATHLPSTGLVKVLPGHTAIQEDPCKKRWLGQLRQSLPSEPQVAQVSLHAKEHF